MDVMPIYIIERKFAETSGKSLTYPCAPYHAVPSVCMCAWRALAQARVPACARGAACTGDHASPLWNSRGATGDGGADASDSCEALVCVRVLLLNMEI